MARRSKYAGLGAVVSPALTELKRFKVNVSGHIVDDDGIGGTDEIDYNWEITESILPGGVPFKRYDAAECDQEVRVAWDVGFYMDTSEKLYISGTVQLFEGTPSDKDLVAENHFGPIAIDRGTEREAADLTLEDDEGDSATIKIVVANNL